MRQLVADIGGTNIRVAIMEDECILDEQRIEAKLSALAANQPKQAETMLIKLLGDAFNDLIQRYQPQCIGIGFPGFFDAHTGILLASPNIPMVQNFDLAQALSKHTSLTTTVQNDALCAALGEYHYGIGKDLSHNDLVHITLGTGVGAGLILNGQPYAGQHGLAMEFGHMAIQPLQGDAIMLCGCGHDGCLETYASATAVVKRYTALTPRKLPQQGISAKEICERAKTGDAQARQVVEHAGHYLGVAIGEMSKLLDIASISLSGGLTGAWSLLYPSMHQSLQSQLISPLRHKINIQRSQLGDNAGLFGASRLNSD